jgi:branched-chain amino acid transport system permease protein
VIADHLFFACINVLLAWSVYVVLLSGSLSFAQGAFMALGCYCAGVLTVKLGWPLLPSFLIAGLFSATLAMLVGYPTVKLKGIYLILVTLGVTVCVRVLLENFKFIGGVGGFGGMQGADLNSALWTVAFVALCLYVFSQGALQRVCDAVREDELVASAMGIDVARVKLYSFACGAFIAGLAGALYGHYMKFVRPENFDASLSIYVVLYVVLGGVNNLWGPLLGALVMTLLPEYIRVLAEWRPTVFGLAILIILLVRPQGILQFRTNTHRLKESLKNG